MRRRTRAGLVARSAERELFRGNFDTTPEDGRHRFLFHVHGTAGVGKTRLVREFEHLAGEQGALTAYVNETSGSVPEVLESVCRQFASGGHRLKDLERMLATHRERRHEAETAALAALDPAPDGTPSTGGMALARAGLAGLGLVPGVAPFAAVLDPAQLAHGADRLRSVLAARFRSHEDVRLVLDPASVLTPSSRTNWKRSPPTSPGSSSSSTPTSAPAPSSTPGSTTCSPPTATEPCPTRSSSSPRDSTPPTRPAGARSPTS
ncbi:ATP-binding protein [Streptomyces erythrogriseus]